MNSFLKQYHNNFVPRFCDVNFKVDNVVFLYPFETDIVKYFLGTFPDLSNQVDFIA